MFQKLKDVWLNLFKGKSLESNKEIDLNDDMDMSQIQDLGQQKKICFKMVNILQGEESRIKNKFMIVQTVNDFLEMDKKIRTRVGEFVGYHFGMINQNMIMVKSAMKNLEHFQAGQFDAIESSARGMYVSLWYNIALTNLESVEDSMMHLESLEHNLIQDELAEHGHDNLILRKGTIH